MKMQFKVLNFVLDRTYHCFQTRVRSIENDYRAGHVEKCLEIRFKYAQCVRSSWLRTGATFYNALAINKSFGKPVSNTNHSNDGANETRNRFSGSVIVVLFLSTWWLAVDELNVEPILISHRATRQIHNDSN